MKRTQLKILDCTLRDGGYYNNWDFDSELVESYLDCMVAASIDIVEIGFRSPPKRSFMGPFVYSLDSYLETLPISESISLGVMINADEYLSSADGPIQLIDNLFQPSKLSRIDLVRIAINFENALEAEVLAHRLKGLGYQVGLNLMQSHNKTENHYQSTAQTITDWQSVDVLYFADSLGSMAPSEVAFICKVLLSTWNGPLGFHAHNNKGMALINSLTALEHGSTWCDSTIMGLGRGAGNVSTESLLMETEYLKLHSGRASTISPSVEMFKDLRKQFTWGPNPYYHYAANHNIHPSFVQLLLNDPRYSPRQINSILDSLSNIHSTSFSDSALRTAIYGNNNDTDDGSWDATGWLDGRDVLLVAAGSSVKRYRQAILSFINLHKPVVLFLNINFHLPNSAADATIVSNESRIFFDAQLYMELGHPVIMPESKLRAELGNVLDDLEILDYGLNLQDGAFDVGPTNCFLQWPLVAAYALAIITQAREKQAYMVGFDGYEPNDPRQEEMNEVLASYARLKNGIPLKALTPTNYQIRQGSIFEPTIQLNDFIVVIPARYQSSRFPGKPLADLCGNTLIQRVWQKCVQAVGHDQVLVATDSDLIYDHCLEQNMKVTMTSSKCLTGTDRVCEVARSIEREIYINVQGDEPLIEPSDILTVLEAARKYRGSIINGMCPIFEDQDFRSPNVPKVVAAPDGTLLYMSRAPIPTGKRHEFKSAMRQVCIYAFPRKEILEFGRHTEKTAMENIEDIEILRFLELGHPIRMVNVKGSPIAVDTPEDLERAKSYFTETKK